jgi:hypothetical protein
MTTNQTNQFPEEFRTELDAFDKWWHHFGSGITPLVGHDASEHAQRVARISWLVASQSTAKP